MSKNPHPQAGKTAVLLEVGAMYECIPCLSRVKHQWAERALNSEHQLAASQESETRLRDALRRAELRELEALAELDEVRAELAAAKHLNGRWMDEATQAKIVLELCQAQMVALREALGELTDWGLSSDDVVSIARAALVAPGNGEEQITDGP